MYSRLDWVTWTSQQKLPQLPGRHKTSQSVYREEKKKRPRESSFKLFH